MSEELKSAKSSFRALKTHHKELVVNRLEELANGLGSALEKLPDNAKNAKARKEISRKLRGIQHMMDWAEVQQQEKPPQEQQQEKSQEQPPQQQEPRRPNIGKLSAKINDKAYHLSGRNKGVRTKDQIEIEGAGQSERVPDTAQPVDSGKSPQSVNNTVDLPRDGGSIPSTAANETAKGDESKGKVMDRSSQIKALEENGFSIKDYKDAVFINGKRFNEVPTLEEAEREVGAVRDKEKRETDEYNADKVAYLKSKKASELTEDRKAEKARMTVARAVTLIPDYSQSIEGDWQRANAWLRFTDPKTGNRVVKEIDLAMTDEEIKAMLPAAKKEMKKKQKETQSRMQAERELNKE